MRFRRYTPSQEGVPKKMIRPVQDDYYLSRDGTLHHYDEGIYNDVDLDALAKALWLPWYCTQVSPNDTYGVY